MFLKTYVQKISKNSYENTCDEKSSYTTVVFIGRAKKQSKTTKQNVITNSGGIIVYTSAYTCVGVSFAKFLRTPFLQSTSEWLALKMLANIWRVAVSTSIHIYERQTIFPAVDLTH